MRDLIRLASRVYDTKRRWRLARSPAGRRPAAGALRRARGKSNHTKVGFDPTTKYQHTVFA